jgi:hypothetical protein
VHIHINFGEINQAALESTQVPENKIQHIHSQPKIRHAMQ